IFFLTKQPSVEAQRSTTASALNGTKQQITKINRNEDMMANSQKKMISKTKILLVDGEERETA
ncbi:hypothetical protein HK096_011580, partial [Nowakowskiella sp. JEL0078]